MWGSFNEATLATALASALVGHSRIHILVLTLTATPDWKLLFTSLAQHGLVAGATPPQVRITFIVPYIMSAPMVHIQKAFLVLRDQALAEGIICGVPVECTLVFAAPADFHPQLVRIDPAETVAVASWLALKTLPDGSVLRHSPRDSLLKVPSQFWCLLPGLSPDTCGPQAPQLTPPAVHSTPQKCCLRGCMQNCIEYVVPYPHIVLYSTLGTCTEVH